MKVSLINLNLVAGDAVGACIVNQVNLFRRRGDDVRVYVCHPPQGISDDVRAVTEVVHLADLITGGKPHFVASDLYIYHYPSRHDLMESIRGLDRGTVVFYYHNVTPPELWGSATDREALVKGIEGKSLAHYADLCITPSPYNQRDLVESVGMEPDRVRVLPLAVALDQFSPGPRSSDLAAHYGIVGQRVLLFVGRMAGNKRIDLLVEALSEIKRQVPTVRLLLVGDDRSSPAYKEVVARARARADELGVAGDVTWTGPVEDLPAHLRLADIYVTASQHEGFGVPLIEAMASGVPVIASRSGAMPWVLGDAGLTFEPGNASDLAEKAVRLLQDSAYLRDLAERGLERARSFSVEAYEAGLMDLLDQAMAYRMPRAAREAPAGGTAASRAGATGERERALLSLLADEIQAHSDVALRGYTVQSRLPLIGPLVAWVRRNLTSHLREPYLDPIVERQVGFNRRAAEWFRRVGALLAGALRQQSELEARVQALEAQLEALRRQVEGSRDVGEEQP